MANGDFEGLESFVKAIASHPAAITYFIEDMFIIGHAPYESAVKVGHIIEKWAPDTLFLSADFIKTSKLCPVINGGKAFKDMRFMEEIFDSGSNHWYPFPRPIEDSELHIPAWLKYHLGTEKPIYCFLQSIKNHHLKKDRQGWPRTFEYRLQAYTSVIYDAKALIYFGAHVQEEPIAGNWEYLKELVSELRDMSPIFTSPTSKKKVGIKGSDKLCSILKEYDGKNYLIVANRDLPEVNASFKLPFSSEKITVRYENREIAPESNRFMDTFEKYAVHVYEIQN